MTRMIDWADGILMDDKYWVQMTQELARKLLNSMRFALYALILDSQGSELIISLFIHDVYCLAGSFLSSSGFVAASTTAKLHVVH